MGERPFDGCVSLIKSAYPNNLSNPFENGIALAYDYDCAVFENGFIYNHDRSALYFAPLDLEGDYILPESVISICESAFYGCGALVSVKTLSVTPASMPVNVFEGLYETVKLTVPDFSVNKYLATGWGLFKNIQTNSGKELPYFSDGNLEYRLNTVDLTATVTGAKNYSSLSIPESFIDDSDPADPVKYYVKSIGVEAFKGKDVTSIDFDPECRIEFIGDYAFADTDISSFKLPASVTVIGNYAFYNTPDLFKVELNEGLATIGESSFAAPEIRYGKVITIPLTVNAIGADAFYNFECTKVETPDIAAWCRIDFGSAYSNPIHNLGNLYVGGEQLTSLQIPEGLEEVKPYAFYNCHSLQNVIFPEGLKRIGSESFYGCGNISDLRIPSSVFEIGERVFANNTVTFSDGLSPIDIKDDAFYYGVQNLYWGRPLDGQMFNLNDIRSLELGGLITEIPDCRFKDCWTLSSLILGSGLKTIGNEAFSGCTGLWQVILPPSVETIGASAFAGDSGLGTIIMGQNVKTIGERAFNGTVASTVSITAQVPPTAPNNTFSKYEGNLYLQGNDAVDAYSNAPTCWNRFDSYVMVNPTGMDLDVAGDIGGNPGDTFQLKARLMPEDVTLPQIFWRSTNPAVATVDQNGLVTLHADNVEATTRARVLASCKIIAESLYADGPVAEVSLTGDVTGVGEIVIEGNKAIDIDYSQPYDIYNMSGLKVGESTDGLSKGIYILRQGKAAVKTVVR